MDFKIDWHHNVKYVHREHEGTYESHEPTKRRIDADLMLNYWRSSTNYFSNEDCLSDKYINKITEASKGKPEFLARFLTKFILECDKIPCLYISL